MLDEFVRQTGYNRKYAVHILTHPGDMRRQTGKSLKKAYFGEDPLSPG
jgi:hypothetical protein